LAKDEVFDLLIARDAAEHFTDAGSHGLRADDTIAQYETRQQAATLFQPPALNWFSRLQYRWKYWRAIGIDPAYNFGHGIFGLFRKV
jgi:hypothetical protein